jgi:transcriptional regulator with XRE-family HTH domain
MPPLNAPAPRNESKTQPPRHVNSFIDFWLGQQLRDLRKDRGLSLQALAADCGISVGTLSQVERGITSASVKTLSRLSQRLGVSANSLLRNIERQEGELGGWVARAKDHRALVMKDRKIIKEIITPDKCASLDLYRARIEPGGSSGPELFITDGGEIAGTVIQGSMELWIENQLILLEEGDSFCYPSRAPRRWRNPGDTDTCVIWAISKYVPESKPVTPRSRT